MKDTNLVIPVFKCKRKNILRRFSITFSKIYKTFYKKKTRFNHSHNYHGETQNTFIRT